MVDIAGKLNQSALFWSKASGQGQASVYADEANYNPPQLIPCRWQEAAEERPDGTNQVRVSKAKIWILDPTVDVDDWLLLLTPLELEAYAAGDLNAPDDPEAKSGLGISMTTGSPDVVTETPNIPGHPGIFEDATDTGIALTSDPTRITVRVDGEDIFMTSMQDILGLPATYAQGDDFLTQQEAIDDYGDANLQNAYAGDTTGGRRIWLIRGWNGNLFVFNRIADGSAVVVQLVQPGAQVTTNVPLTNAPHRIFSRRVIPGVRPGIEERVVWIM